MILTASDLGGLEQRFRATLLNSLAGVRPAVLVGTRDLLGQDNLAVFNSGIHIGADPALYGLLFRPSTVERHTLENILTTGSYSVNYMPASLADKVHQTSAKYPRNESEFAATGLTPQREPSFVAPRVGEAVVSMLLALDSVTPIPANGTSLVIGRIEKLLIPDNQVASDGYVSFQQADILCSAGLDAYYRGMEIGRLRYARPGQNSEWMQPTHAG